MYLSLGLLTLTASYITLSDARKPTPKTYDTHDYYVLEHNPAHGLSPYQCAEALGTHLVEQVGELKNHYVLSVPKAIDGSSTYLPRRALATARNYEPVTVLQALRKRAVEAHNVRAHSKRLSSSIRSLELQTARQRLVKRGTLLDEVIQTLDIRDPLFPKQWHIVNEEFPGHMMNVTGVWKEGITGKNVISAIVDDGLDYESEDLAPNFVSNCLYSFFLLRYILSTGSPATR
jgi:kexin